MTRPLVAINRHPSERRLCWRLIDAARPIASFARHARSALARIAVAAKPSTRLALELIG
jgi:hypothetical protein